MERKEELQASWFEGFTEVGIFAGASIPDDVAQQIASFATGGKAEKAFHTPAFTPTHANR